MGIRIRKIIIWVIMVAFGWNSFMPVPACAQALFSNSGVVALSPAWHPLLLTCVKVYPEDPWRLDFILDQGDTASVSPADTNRLIRYFFAALAIPEKDMWVNLSPYEKNRIVPQAFGSTGMGQDLLSQDYLLKQVTASLMFPDGEFGKKFWTEVYRQAQDRFGTTDIPVDMSNKVWIVPEYARILEGKGAAYVARARLKVMLEKDYSAITGVSLKETALNDADNISGQVMRAVIIPAIEKEVNEGQNFAPLRQIYHSLILAAWYKRKVKASLLKATYVDRS